MRREDFYSNLIKGYRGYSALIVSIDENPRIYIQFAFMPAENHLIWETVSNKFLKKREKLTTSQEKMLEAMGFSLGNGPNFSQRINVQGNDTFEDVVRKSIKIFINVYLVSPSHDIIYEYIS